MRVAGILLAGGRGARLGGRAPKALATLGGESLLARALRTATSCAAIEALVVAAPQGYEDDVASVVSGAEAPVTVVTGGETRQASVRRGLDALPTDAEAVVCHDVARPFASPELFDRVLRALRDADGAVPVIPVADTVKRLRESSVVETLPRDDLGLAQTPQAFRRTALEAAHRDAERAGFTGTDDAVLLERAGFVVATVPGDPRNLKITDPSDLARAAAMLAGD